MIMACCLKLDQPGSQRFDLCCIELLSESRHDTGTAFGDALIDGFIVATPGPGIVIQCRCAEQRVAAAVSTVTGKT